MDRRPRTRREWPRRSPPRVTKAPGLYFLGFTWQHTRGSALLGWVKDDAEFLAHPLDAFAAGTPDAVHVAGAAE
jgi:hypothetical protein